MTDVLHLGCGGSVVLGAVLARAGEGAVLEVAGRADLVAKVFHSGLADLAGKGAKVAAMVASPPAGAVQPDGFVVLTWPQDVLLDDTGAVAGYVMARIDTSNAVEIHTVSNPSNRNNPLASAPQWTPHATWMHLLTVAANLCLAVEVVHRVDAVIGDFQERNILVSDTSRVSLVDCDSMQFTDPQGRQYLCAVGRPEFTAPELAGVDLAHTAREKPSDLFALAVHIHQLLMGGNHPFLRGIWIGAGEQPDALSLARTGSWAGGPGSPLNTHPLAPPPTFLPDTLQRLFTRAFTDGARDPAARPSAAEWRTALQRVQVRTCDRGHQIPVKTYPCPWCVIDTHRTTRHTQHSQQTQQTIRQATPPPPAEPTQTTTYPTTYPTPSPKPTKTRTLLLTAAAITTAITATTIGIIATQGQGEDATADSTTIPSDWLPSGGGTERAPSNGSSPSTIPGDLNLGVPMTRPKCDGTAIVVLYSAVTPGRYEAEIQKKLNQYPGSSYLRTDQSCPSLRQRSDQNTPIYAVYRVAGRSRSELCAAIRSAGGDAYGKFLDTTSDPTVPIVC